MPITKPAVEAADYLEEDSAEIQPKVGTTVQDGWDAAEALLKVETSEFPTDFRFSEEPQLVKFLQDRPFATYEQHGLNAQRVRSLLFVSVMVAHSAKSLVTRLVENLRSTYLYFRVETQQFKSLPHHLL